MVSDYGHKQGGAEVCMDQIREGLKCRGHDVRVVSSSVGLHQVSAGLRFADYQVFGTSSSLRVVAQTCNPLARRQLQTIIKEFQPDLIHLNLFLTQLSPDILDAFSGIPVLYHAHWYRMVCMTGLKMLHDGSSCPHSAGLACLRERCVPLHDWLLLTWQFRRLKQRRRAINAIIAPSDIIRKKLESEGYVVDYVIPYGVKMDVVRGPLSDPPRVAFAGRLVPAKGGDILLEAFARVAAQLPQARLDIFGTGPEEQTLKTRCRVLGIADRVDFHGWVEQVALQRILNTCWLQIAPSVFEEPFGIVAIEAAERGTAVVASNHGGYRETVLNGVTGILVPPMDVEATAAAMLRILKDRAYAETLGQAGRKHALHRFGLPLFLTRLEQAMEETLQRFRNASLVGS